MTFHSTIEASTAQPSIPPAPSLSMKPSVIPSQQPSFQYGKPSLENESYDLIHEYLYLFLLGSLIVSCCCCCFFATKARDEIRLRRIEIVRRRNEENKRIEQVRDERREFILRNIVIERRIKTPSLSKESVEEDTSLENFSIVGADSSNDGSQRLVPKGSIRNIFEGIVCSNNMFKGICKSSTLDYDVCAICLDEYGEKEQICSSPNERCHHKFHLDCMVSWLIDHEKCPICRLTYLEEDEENNSIEFDITSHEADETLSVNSQTN